MSREGKALAEEMASRHVRLFGVTKAVASLSRDSLVNIYQPVAESAVRLEKARKRLDAERREIIAQHKELLRAQGEFLAHEEEILSRAEAMFTESQPLAKLTGDFRTDDIVARADSLISNQVRRRMDYGPQE